MARPLPATPRVPNQPIQASQVMWNTAPDEAERKLTHDVAAAITAGAYRTPVLPEAAAEALRLSRNALASLERIEKLIAADPPLAAKLVSIANSPIYHGAEPFRSLRAAMVRMGLEQVREVLGQAVLASHIFDVPPFRSLLADVIAEAAAVAIACAQLADQSGMAVDEAYLSGLLHDLGKTVVLQILAKNQIGLAAPPAVVARLIDGEHERAGTLAAHKMRLPEPLVTAISRHHVWRPGVAEDAPAALVSLARRAWAAATTEVPAHIDWPELSALDLVEPQVHEVIAHLVQARERLTQGGAASLGHP